jgi:effector-binding domain-containing protein/uncharacterized protein YndB with AHSA1/START domain
MRLFKKIVLGLVVLVVVLAGIGFLLPRQVHVERTAVIEASPSTLFTVLNNFKMFNKWSPWAALDPNAEYTYAGAATGVGSSLSWKGDPKKVGSGSQEIVESVPFERVKTSLDFGGQGGGTALFTLTPEGEGTRVVWAFDSDLGMNPLSRYFGLMFDKMVGGDYEKGLASLKTLAEGMPKADFSDLKVEEVQVAPVTVAYVAATCGKDDAEIARALGESYAQVGLFMKSRKLSQAAAPITINRKFDDSGYEFDAAIPLDRTPEKEIPTDSAVQVKQTYGGKALKVVHKGPYRDMKETYAKLTAYMAASGIEAAGPPWDEYVSDPGTTAESELLTNIFIPIS